MEFFIVMISVPLFLIIVGLLSVFVLANYSRPEPEKASPSVEETTGQNKDVDLAI
jgi:hypothetical protein